MGEGGKTEIVSLLLIRQIFLFPERCQDLLLKRGNEGKAIGRGDEMRANTPLLPHPSVWWEGR